MLKSIFYSFLSVIIQTSKLSKLFVTTTRGQGPFEIWAAHDKSDKHLEQVNRNFSKDYGRVLEADYFMGFIGTLGNIYNLFKLLTAAVLTRTRTCIDLLCRTLQSIVHFYSFVALILRLKVVNFLKTFMDKIYLKGLIYRAYKNLSKGLAQQTNFL